MHRGNSFEGTCNYCATGDAVSFGQVRSVMKIPVLLQYTALMSREQENSYETWVNGNINGVKVSELISSLGYYIMTISFFDNWVKYDGRLAKRILLNVLANIFSLLTILFLYGAKVGLLER